MTIDDFSKLLIENAMSQLEEKSKCNHSGAGTSCPTHGDADGDTFAISGTKMRRAAFAADFKTFRQGIPTALKDTDCKKLMDEIRTRLPANFK